VGFADILKSRPLGRVISAYRTPRMSGLEIDPNYFVLYLTPGLLLSLWAILDRQRLINRKLCYLVFISSLFCLFFSLSRTGIVINIFFVFLSFLFMAKRIRFQHIFIAAMIGCFLLLPIFKEIIRRFELLKYEFKGIGMGRYSLLLFGLDLFKKAPILGIGFNQYAEYYARYHGQIRYAHNTFLSILVELGIVGLTLYLFFLSIILKNVYKAIKVNASKYTWIFQAFTMVLLSQIVQIGSLFAITSSALWMSLIVVSLLILNSKKMEQGMY
jgi:O-antigen ligase